MFSVDKYVLAWTVIVCVCVCVCARARARVFVRAAFITGTGAARSSDALL